MAPRLKVFTWSDGFHAHPVAVSSRAKALAAWGAEQDLFKSGYAREVTSGPDFEAAMASPGEVMRRGEAIDIGEITRAPKPRRRGPTPAQVARVAALDAELEALDAAWQVEEADRAQALARLEREARDARARHESDRAALRRKLSAARRARGG